MKKNKMLKMNNKGVFGLTSVQQFFAIILGVALLAYVIVVIMGTLQGSTILSQSSLTKKVVLEPAWINNTGYVVSNFSTPGFTGLVINQAMNRSAGINLTINALNYSVTAANGYIVNITFEEWENVWLNYTFNYHTANTENSNNILRNTSSGIASFFASITSVWSILAILVIILVLIVLVRVVSGSTEGGMSGKTAWEPQL